MKRALRSRRASPPAPIVVSLAWAACAIVTSAATEPPGIITTRDEALQLSWIAPKKPPYSRSHEGLWHGDTFSWRCYPVIAESIGTRKQALLLKIELDGPGYWSADGLAVFNIDSTLFQVTFNPSAVRAFRTLAGNNGVEITLTEQAALAVKIAKASDVWVSLIDSTSKAGRHSVQLSPLQRAIFAKILERYRTSQ